MKTLVAAVAIMAVVFALGCDGGKNSPAAPTPAVEATSTAAPPPAPSGSGATISGVLRSSTGAASFGPSTFASAITVQAVGTGVSAFVDASGNFELKGVPPADVVLRFTGSGLDASVSVGMLQSGETVQLTIVVNGSLGVISGDSRLSHGQARELEGIIEALQPPLSQFVVRSQVVEVAASTKIKHGSRLLTYTDLAVGLRVHVRGTTSVTATGNVLTAEIIEVQTGDSQGDEMNLSGRVDSPYPTSGSCSALPMAFNVGGKAVKADASTVFKPSCGALAAGVKVDVEGLLQPDGSVLAKKVEVDVESLEKDVSGIVGTPFPGSGSCAALPVTFKVGSTVVKADAATKFNPSCLALAAGAKVDVEGLVQADGSLLAKKIDIEDGAKSVSLAGTVSAVTGGSCGAANLSFDVTVSGVNTHTRHVKTTGSTVFGSPCATITAGARVSIEGQELPGSDIVTASKVTVNSPPGSVTVSGTLSGLSSVAGCPLVTFLVSARSSAPSSVSVQTLSSTVFAPGCALLKNGDTVKVVGAMAGDKLTASSVERK